MASGPVYGTVHRPAGRTMACESVATLADVLRRTGHLVEGIAEITEQARASQRALPASLCVSELLVLCAAPVWRAA